MYLSSLHGVSKKFPPLNSLSLSNLNRFSKPVWHDPPHLRHVATLPWEIKNSNFLQIFSRYGRKCKQIAFLIASNFASCSLNWLQVQFFNSLLFYLFTFAINVWHRKFVTAVTDVSVNNQHGMKWCGQDLYKTFIWNQLFSMRKDSLF